MKAKARNCKALPGYQHRLLAATPELATLRGISHCMIEHDDGCGSFQRHPCTCVPHISVVNGDNLLLIATFPVSAVSAISVNVGMASVWVSSILTASAMLSHHCLTLHRRHRHDLPPRVMTLCMPCRVQMSWYLRP
jgi:hypothetical protein